MVGERGDVRVVVAEVRAERGEQGEDLQGGGLADVAYKGACPPMPGPGCKRMNP